ncbi:MAG: FAD-binding oxidoreductase [Aquabacterium sp.]|uniref:FAD-binding oxidoreductase n=1 Tax=Aquabacterium sp. TaxID=1872578 RepID=UPI0025BD95D1|nr:FAD-binding oxidoreductase [Aquabacterium sp.]MBI5926263.1 FAD-binding oxidoreductase [Aquabacterium sp.]
MTTLLNALRDLLGQAQVLIPQRATDAEFSRYQTDWRGRYQGHALAIVRPANADEVAAVVRLCAQHGVSIVPQGGNTGLVGGGVPDESGRQVVLSLQRLRQIREVDPANLSMTADAGCLLAEVQQAAAEAGLLFPLSLASEGSCTIGGNLATNAGGTQVLRYGTARELCLGLEVVTANGEIWRGLKGLRKDNSGYALRDLMIGSEGTLGIITAATLRLYPQPKGQTTALLSCTSLSDAIKLLQAARADLDAGLTACEVMGRLPLQLVQGHQPDAAKVLLGLQATTSDTTPAAWTVLLENASNESDEHAQQRMQTVLQMAMDSGLVQMATLAVNQTQQQAMWQLRESIPLAERTEGLMVKHDIGVPTSAIPDFVREADQAIQTRWPQARIVCFGHLGDGNLHYNVQPPPSQGQGIGLTTFESEVNRLVFDEVMRHGGTLSAEHGVGRLRVEEMGRRQSVTALAMMKAIKLALDPGNVLNPGRVLP